MKILFTIACCLILGCALAETIQNVEYYLPPAAQKWEVNQMLQNENGTTFIYFPNGEQKQHA
jgi:hypothetical protein